MVPVMVSQVKRGELSAYASEVRFIASIEETEENLLNWTEAGAEKVEQGDGGIIWVLWMRHGVWPL